MPANTDVMTNEGQGLPIDWEKTRCWASSRIKPAGKAVAGLAAFLGFAALVEYALYQMVQNWTIVGGGAAAFGFF
jgi:hypothetical protein